MKDLQAQNEEKDTGDGRADAAEAGAEPTREQAEHESPEAEPSETAEAEGKQESEKEDTIESLREQLEAQKDKYIRLMAEFDNFKRRTGKEYERIVESANERLMLQIIEVRESFERALKVENEKGDLKAFFDGMKLIFARLDEVLEKNGLSVFTEVGDEFDPEIHDAMMKAPHEEIPEDHIVDIYEKGYKLRNRVIKHARVIVSSGPGQKADQDGKEQEKEQQRSVSN